MKIEFKKWYVAIDICEYSIGIGWWHGSAKLYTYTNTWYDGWWWGMRIGPFFINRGP